MGQMSIKNSVSEIFISFENKDLLKNQSTANSLSIKWITDGFWKKTFLHGCLSRMLLHYNLNILQGYFSIEKYSCTKDGKTHRLLSVSLRLLQPFKFHFPCFDISSGRFSNNSNSNSASVRSDLNKKHRPT